MNFKDFFGIEPDKIRKNCILCQNYDLTLFSNESKSGFFVKTAQTPNATVIALKNNFLAGDAVLCLHKSRCENIILFGSCGGCGDVESGDIIMTDKAYNFESFSKMLFREKEPDFISSSPELLSDFYGRNLYADIIKTNSACVGSIVLESEYIDFFKSKDICAIDMESSIVFSAAKKIGARVACFMYIADHLEKNPLGKELNVKTKEKISSSRKKLAEMILDFTNEK